MKSGPQILPVDDFADAREMYSLTVLDDSEATRRLKDDPQIANSCLSQNLVLEIARVRDAVDAGAERRRGRGTH